MTAALTKSTADMLAKRHLQYGHYSDGGNGTYASCPVCRERIDSPWSPLDKKSKHAMLHDRMVAHLLECGGAA